MVWEGSKMETNIILRIICLVFGWLIIFFDKRNEPLDRKTFMSSMFFLVAILL